ncbi:MAG TPA: potassium/proton antiporter [Burkholderiaceae bacterium]|nr:potassium/proton antiporter [Burkholderiaceae bacterium]
MTFINEILLATAVLLFAALLLSAVSVRAGIPSLLIFLAVGLLATELPGAASQPVSTETAALIGNLALAVILLDGGLRTRLSTFRFVAGPALVLASVGVLLSAALVGMLAILWLGFDWRYALLLGAIVGSTDAAAVFALLRTGGVRLNERVEATLEVESGINDPMAVFLVVSLLELIKADATLGGGWAMVQMFALQLGVGALAGVVLGAGLALLVARAHLAEGLQALLIQSGGLLIFAATNLMQGSGFLAIYLAGMVVAQRGQRVGEDVLRVSDGLAWLAQAAMFLILGLFAQLKGLYAVAGEALLIAFGLMLFARPVAVLLCLAPYRYHWREIGFIGWVGLRGAVPIVLGLFPLLAAIEGADRLFHIAFFCVLLSLLFQGATLARAARLANVARPLTHGVLSSASLEATPAPREVVQLRVAGGARIVDLLPEDVDWPADTRIAEVWRDKQRIEGQPLQAGDVVTAIAPSRAVHALEEMLGPAPQTVEWSLDSAVTLGELRDFYGITLSGGMRANETVAGFLQRRLHGRPAAGDSVTLGGVTLSVRQAEGGQIQRVGLRLAQARAG